MLTKSSPRNVLHLKIWKCRHRNCKLAQIFDSLTAFFKTVDTAIKNKKLAQKTGRIIADTVQDYLIKSGVK